MTETVPAYLQRARAAMQRAASASRVAEPASEQPHAPGLITPNATEPTCGKSGICGKSPPRWAGATARAADAIAAWLAAGRLDTLGGFVLAPMPGKAEQFAHPLAFCREALPQFLAAWNDPHTDPARHEWVGFRLRALHHALAPLVSREGDQDHAP